MLSIIIVLIIRFTAHHFKGQKQHINDPDDGHDQFNPWNELMKQEIKITAKYHNDKEPCAYPPTKSNRIS